MNRTCFVSLSSAIVFAGVADARAPRFEDLAGKRFCWPGGVVTTFRADGTFTRINRTGTDEGTWKVSQLAGDGETAMVTYLMKKGTDIKTYSLEDGGLVRAVNPDRPMSAHANNGLAEFRRVARRC